MDKQFNYTDPDDDFDPDSYWKKVTGRDEEEDGGDRYWHSFSDHGYINKKDPDYGPVPEEYRSNGMSRAAFTCGILSVISIIFNVSLLFGSLGLVFAFLSRERKFNRQAKAAITLSTVGIAAFAAAVALSIFTLVSTGVWDDMVEKVQQMDPNDPNAISDVQREVLEELQKKLLERDGGPEISFGNGTGGAQTGVAQTDGAEAAGADAADTFDAIDASGTIGVSARAAASGADARHRQMTELLPL